MATLLTYQRLAADLGRPRLRATVERSGLVRATRGVYGVGPLEDDDRLRALFLRLPEGALLSHHSAAQRFGFGVLPSGRVHVLIPAGVPRPQIRGVETHEAVLAVPEPAVVAGAPCAPPIRCAVDLARALRRWDALAVLDAALRSGTCDPAGLAAEVLGHHGLRGGTPGAGPDPVGGRSGRGGAGESPATGAHRRRTAGAGAADLGRRRVRLPDLPGRSGVPGAAGRCRVRRALARRPGPDAEDRTRMNWLAARGWNMRYFTDHDLYRRPSGIVTAVRRLLL